MNSNGNFAPIVEALIMSSPEPLSPRKIADVVADLTPSEVEHTVADLNNKYMTSDSSFRIRKIAGGYQHYITENYASYIEDLNVRRRSTRLSRAALETLAIIAYRQPVTKTDVEMIRGVSSDSAIHTLLERKLVTLAGRSEAVGRPLLYKTTEEFLKFFNLNSHDDLPRMEEIEELISSKEPDNQESLPLGPFVNPYSVNGLKTERSIKLTLRKPGMDDEFLPEIPVADNLTEDESTTEKYIPATDSPDQDNEETTLDEFDRESIDEDETSADSDDTIESDSMIPSSLTENDDLIVETSSNDDKTSLDDQSDMAEQETAEVASCRDSDDDMAERFVIDEETSPTESSDTNEQEPVRTEFDSKPADDAAPESTDEEHGEDYDQEPEPVGVLAEYDADVESDEDDSEPNDSAGHTSEQDRIN